MMNFSVILHLFAPIMASAHFHAERPGFALRMPVHDEHTLFLNATPIEKLLLMSIDAFCSASSATTPLPAPVIIISFSQRSIQITHINRISFSQKSLLM